MNDDIESDSDYDDPYAETALEWRRRSLHHLVRSRCGIDDSSSSSDESLDDDPPFDGWLRSYPSVAARCSLFLKDTASRRKSIRDIEGKRLRRLLRRLSDNHRPKADDNDDPVAAASNEERLLADSILPKGVGVSFIDDVLSNSDVTTKPPMPTTQSMTARCRTVLEINGPARSGMTSVLIAVAARYVANTSSLFFDNPHPNNNTNPTIEKVTSPNTVIDPDDDRTAHDKRRNNDTHETAVTSNEPRAVILDLEHGIHTAKLILSVREAVLRRWEETALARKILKYLYSNQQKGRCDRNHEDDANDEIDAIGEQRHIERVMASCLERIHIVQPRDYTYLSLVATIESLNKRLEDDRLLYRSNDANSNNGMQQRQQQPPTMLIIDSLSTLDACTKAQEGLPSVTGSVAGGGSGLSERHQFYSQLGRLRDEHEVFIMGSCRKLPNEENGGGTGGLWDKMVTNRVGLFTVADGTEEQRRGFDFVATVKNGRGGEGAGSLFPYSVTNGGINS